MGSNISLCQGWGKRLGISRKVTPGKPTVTQTKPMSKLESEVPTSRSLSPQHFQVASALKELTLEHTVV